MMDYLATSRYLLVLDHAESRYRKDRLSGAIPLGLTSSPRSGFSRFSIPESSPSGRGPDGRRPSLHDLQFLGFPRWRTLAVGRVSVVSV